MLLLVVIGTACEEISDQGLELVDDSLLVVDGGITNERMQHEIRLTQTFKSLEETAPPVTDALVVITDSVNFYLLTHDDTNPGTYKTDSMRALFGKVYLLYIRYDGKEYGAIATSDIGTPLPPLQVQDAGDSHYEYIHQESVPSMTKVSATWTEGGEEVKKEAFYYTLDVIDITKTFAPEKESFTFPVGARLERRKFSLTQNHQNFLRSFLSEVDWRGGGFDAAPGNVLTNMSEGAVGFFYVSMVDSDNTLIND